MLINNILIKKITITVFILSIARMGIFVPIPGIDHDTFYNKISNNTLVNFLNIFSGGGFSTIGIFALGIVPYINASLVIQLLTKIIPQLEKMQKDEGESGRQKIIQITRYLTLVWAIIQSIAISLWIKPYVFYWNMSFLLDTMISLTTGSMIIMWLSEIITEKGIGNGASLLIFQNIISNIPQQIKTLTSDYNQEIFIKISFFCFFFILMLILTVLIQEGVRKITIISIRQLLKKNKLDPQSYLPLKLNQGGVMPIVFASASMAIPSYIQEISNQIKFYKLTNLFTYNSPFYILIYGVLIIAFSYFYSSLILNTNDISQNLKKMGASIPNVRPGEETSKFLQKIINRLTFLGSMFLFTIALVPSIISQITAIDTFKGLGATSLLILVGVAIDTAKQIQTYVISEQYESLMK
uniref:Protein translocase subunit SecY n=1 Tax=Kumanoa americana TaxID=1196377 RepID=A0A1C9CGX8_9FLOR|nr:preprotein translocase subunit SecY [Kumanoa americana]AOM67615.1 preprotein translocase subunit SecY [Kumanoa americana]